MATLTQLSIALHAHLNRCLKHHQIRAQPAAVQWGALCGTVLIDKMSHEGTGCAHGLQLTKSLGFLADPPP